MTWKKGARVRHAARPDWGVGEVIENSTAATVRIFFTNAGVKSFLPASVKLEAGCGHGSEELRVGQSKSEGAGGRRTNISAFPTRLIASCTYILRASAARNTWMRSATTRLTRATVRRSCWTHSAYAR
jgi:hypothetical protein